MSETANDAQNFAEAIAAATSVPAEPAPVAAPEAAPAAPAADQVVAAAPPVADPKLAALLEREASVDAKLAEAKALLERLQAAPLQDKPKAPAKKPPRLWADVIKEQDPDADPGAIAEQLWYEKLGRDKAPAEYQARILAAEVAHDVDSKLSEVNTKLEQLSRAQEQLNIERYRSHLAAEAPKLPADKTPLVSKLVSAKPSEAVEQLMEIADQIARREQRIPTHAEAAEALEKYLTQMRDLYAPVFGVAAPAPAAPTAQKTTSGPSTLWNNQVKEQPPKAAPDPNDDDALRRAAFAAMGVDPSMVDRVWRK
jgi:hypothetical protein